MNTRSLLLFLLLMINKNISAQNYSVQVLNTGFQNLLNSIYFVDDMTGYAVTQDGGYIKTTDGGVTWSYNLISFDPLREVYFTNVANGYIAGSEGIFMTSDAGVTWTNVKPGDYRSVYFTSLDTGYAGGFSGPAGGISKTTDGGNTWVKIYNSAPVAGLFFINSKIGYGGRIYYPYTTFYSTTNGGSTWTATNILGLSFGAVCFYFTDSLNGYVGEAGHGIYKTTDGGITWTSLNYGTIFSLNSFHFLDSQTGFAVGSDWFFGKILQTTDGGSTWTTLYQGIDTNNIFTDVFFPTPCTGYVAGNMGIVVKLECIPAGIGETNIADNDFNIFPNPSSGLITLTIPATTNQIEIVNSLGQLVEYRTVAEQTSVKFILKERGIYFLRVTTAEGSIVKKFVVNN